MAASARSCEKVTAKGEKSFIWAVDFEAAKPFDRARLIQRQQMKQSSQAGYRQVVVCVAFIPA